MRGSGLKHDIECEQASRSILTKWKNGDWTNNFIDMISGSIVLPSFPSPDQCFILVQKTGIAPEFKITESKKGYINWLGINYCISEEL